MKFFIITETHLCITRSKWNRMVQNNIQSKTKEWFDQQPKKNASKKQVNTYKHCSWYDRVAMMVGVLLASYSVFMLFRMRNIFLLFFSSRPKCNYIYRVHEGKKNEDLTSEMKSIQYFAFSMKIYLSRFVRIAQRVKFTFFHRTFPFSYLFFFSSFTLFSCQLLNCVWYGMWLVYIVHSILYIFNFPSCHILC